MKVVVNDIVEEGFKVEEDIEAARWDLDSLDMKFMNKIHLKCNFLKAGKEIFVKAEIATHRLIKCSRCLQEINQEVAQDFNFCYTITRLGNYLDMDSDIREEILLNYPMKVLCKSDFKGICPHCGINLNFKECQCQNREETHGAS